MIVVQILQLLTYNDALDGEKNQNLKRKMHSFTFLKPFVANNIYLAQIKNTRIGPFAPTAKRDD